MKKLRPINLKNITTYSIRKRKSKVEIGLSGKPHKKGASFKEFLNGLPSILAARDFKAVVRAIARARKNGRQVALGMGAHPIKVGLSPVIIDLMERGIITSLATNGASIIHDFELAYIGRTSEDVAAELAHGAFGMAEETGKYINKAIKSGVKKNKGLGESIGEFIHKSGFKYKEKSVFGAGYRLGIPMTVHVALGSDIIHMHPGASGSAIGEASMRDFRIFASVISCLDEGVYINLGSAVIMPEVFLKALTVARNLGNRVENITTVNMDFIQSYRPCENVLRRPTIGGGASCALTGHHEIMFPLLAASVIEEMGK
jgi:deoxyhypusine synthase